MRPLTLSMRTKLKSRMLYDREGQNGDRADRWHCASTYCSALDSVSAPSFPSIPPRAARLPAKALLQSEVRNEGQLEAIS